MKSSRTLWMGNIDPWMKEENLMQLFNSFSNYSLLVIPFTPIRCIPIKSHHQTKTKQKRYF